MEKIQTYKYYLSALFAVIVWGATFVSTKVLITNGLTPAEIFMLRFEMAHLCIWQLSLTGRCASGNRADGSRG